MRSEEPELDPVLDGLFEHSDYHGDIVDHTECLVVGSGPGGGTIAHELAAAGRQVILVEAGPRIRTRDFRANDAGYTLSHYFWNGGARATRGNVFMPTLQAKVLGGGSVFNSAICMRTPEFILQRWAQRHGLDELNSASLAPHFAAVEEFMHVRPTQDAVQGSRNELFRQGAQELGWGVEACSRNEAGCRGSGNCFTGCPTRGKQSLDVRGVPELVRKGGRVYSSVRVEQLIMDGQRVRGVIGVVEEPFTGKVLHKVRITAKCTILAAGAIASPVIMRKSGIRREPVGSNLGFHPGSAVIAVYDEDVEPWSGASQGYHVLDFLEDGIKLESLWATTTLMAFRFPSFGPMLKGLLADYRKMASWDLWVSGEDSIGQVRGVPTRSDIQYGVGVGDVHRLQDGMAKLAEMARATGAVRVLHGIHGLPHVLSAETAAEQIRAAKLEPNCIPIASNHVFGSAGMGADPAQSVVDHSGKVWDVDGLYVCDTGIIPSTPGVNPMHTVMGLGHRMAGIIDSRC